MVCWKVMILRRYGSAPGVMEVECALAMFSAMIRIRALWERMPEAEVIIVFSRSMRLSRFQPLSDQPPRPPTAVFNICMCLRYSETARS